MERINMSDFMRDYLVQRMGSVLPARVSQAAGGICQRLPDSSTS